jgi:hypothetical protein
MHPDPIAYLQLDATEIEAVRQAGRGLAKNVAGSRLGFRNLCAI